MDGQRFVHKLRAALPVVSNHHTTPIHAPNAFDHHHRFTIAVCVLNQLHESVDHVFRPAIVSNVLQIINQEQQDDRCR